MITLTSRSKIVMAAIVLTLVVCLAIPVAANYTREDRLARPEKPAASKQAVSAVDIYLGSAVPAGAFDAAVMIEVLHEIAPGARQAGIDGCARALASGGWLVIVDETYPATLAEARRPEFLFPVQTGFEELVWGNVVPTRAEQERLLRQAGFAGAIDRSIVGEGFTVLTTQKP